MAYPPPKTNISPEKWWDWKTIFLLKWPFFRWHINFQWGILSVTGSTWGFLEILKKQSVFGSTWHTFCPDRPFVSQCWTALKGTFYTYLSWFDIVLELFGVHSSHDYTTMTMTIWLYNIYITYITYITFWLYDNLWWYNCDTMHRSISILTETSSRTQKICSSFRQDSGTLGSIFF